jgi:hypothetical protein
MLHAYTVDATRRIHPGLMTQLEPTPPRHDPLGAVMFDWYSFGLGRGGPR